MFSKDACAWLCSVRGQMTVEQQNQSDFRIFDRVRWVFTNLCMFVFSRPHKHEDGTRTTGRFIWEIFHKNVGRLGLILALINITLGLFLAVAPVAAWAVWFALLGTFVILYVAMEVRLQLGKKNTKTAAFPMKWFSKLLFLITNIRFNESLIPVYLHALRKVSVW